MEFSNIQNKHKVHIFPLIKLRVFTTLQVGRPERKVCKTWYIETAPLAVYNSTITRSSPIYYKVIIICCIFSLTWLQLKLKTFPQSSRSKSFNFVFIYNLLSGQGHCLPGRASPVVKWYINLLITLHAAVLLSTSDYFIQIWEFFDSTLARKFSILSSLANFIEKRWAGELVIINCGKGLLQGSSW